MPAGTYLQEKGFRGRAGATALNGKHSISRRVARPGAGWIWTVRALIVVAIAVASYLTVVSLIGGAQPLGCGADSNCAAVLASAWSRIGPVPVGVLALLLYAVMLAAMSLFSPATSGPQRRGGWLILVTCAVAVLAAAAWFIWLQHRIGSICYWCLGQHAIGLLIAAMILLRAPWGRERFGPHAPPREALLTPALSAAVVLIGVLGVAVVAVGQDLFKREGPQAAVEMVEVNAADLAPAPVAPAPVAAQPARVRSQRGRPPQPMPGPRRQVKLLNGQVRLSLPLPMLGSLEARHVIIELFDYACAHCRQMHAYMAKVQRRYGDQLAVVVLPVPLNPRCNPYVKQVRDAFKDSCELAKLSLAVFSARPGAFVQMDRWLFEGTDAPRAGQARAYALKLVDADALKRELVAGGWPERQISTNINLHRATSGRDKQFAILPKLILPDGVLAGLPKTPEKLFEQLEASMNLTPLLEAPQDARPTTVGG